ncbi:MAG: type II toxin-antitoxin system VapC family toxin [candidate division KSB1 bacterium]|nr:type II toxin-antitoxin system VapC family toxin [candidate division KSB1 bacterium]MDQ7065375.1 type II toxin-antitoxin system VapC family toxin [candidate division KSB1 bacterium]
MNKKIVLDTHALICYLKDEPGADEVENAFEKAQNKEIVLLLNVVNLAEVRYIIERRFGESAAQEFVTTLSSLPVEIVNVEKSLALLAAQIKAKTPISLGDCFCAATAMQFEASLMTGDLEFKKLEDQIDIYWLPLKS